MKAYKEISIEFRYRLILVFSYLIPFSDFWSLRLLILILSISLVFQFKLILENIRNQWGVILYFVVLLLGLLHTSDIKTGLRLIETSASLLLIPLAFPEVKQLSYRKWEFIIQCFTLGLISACFGCLINATYSFYKSGNPDEFFYYDFTSLINLHPTYLAYYLIFAITWILYTHFFVSQERKFSFFYCTILLFLFVVLLLTGGQTSFISLLLVFSYFILKFILEPKSKDRVVTITLISFMLAFMFVVSSNSSNQNMNDSWDRFELWNAAIRANSNVLIGEGTGDFQDVLNQYYQSNRMVEYSSKSLNSHNQFIQNYFSNGIIGLFSVVLLLMIPIYRSFKLGNSLGILVFFPFLIYGVTEVFMGRYQGVVFFAFLMQTFFSLANTKPMSKM